MTPATLRVLCFTFFFAILSIQQCCVCAYSPDYSPSPAPEYGGDLGSPPPIAAAPETPSPSPLEDNVSSHPAPETPSPSPLVANVSSPPAPPPVDRSPNSAPAPLPANRSPNSAPASLPADRSPNSAPAPSPVNGGNATPTPSPAPAPSDIIPENTTANGGMTGGKKAGVAIGVIAAVCVVFLGGLVYKKRRENLQRAQFGYVARSDLL